MQNKHQFFFLVLGVPTLGGGLTWLGQIPKFFQKLDLKAPLTRWSLYCYLGFCDDHLSNQITERQGTAMYSTHSAIEGLKCFWIYRIKYSKAKSGWMGWDWMICERTSAVSTLLIIFRNFMFACALFKTDWALYPSDLDEILISSVLDPPIFRSRLSR